MSYVQIENDIKTFENETRKLKDMLRICGTHDDTDSFRSQLKTQGQQTKILSRKINQDLKALKASTGGRQRIKMSKLKKSFEVALMEYHRAANELEQKERKALQVIQASLPNDSPMGMTNTYDDHGGGHALGIPGGGGGGHYSNDQIQAQAQSQMTDISIEFREATIEDMERKKVAIGEIEQDVKDIQDMFQDLATLVDSQQEGIDDIEANIERAKIHVETGTQELKKAEKHQRKGRKKLCWILMCTLLLLLAILVPVFSLS